MMLRTTHFADTLGATALGMLRGYKVNVLNLTYASADYKHLLVGSYYINGNRLDNRLSNPASRPVVTIVSIRKSNSARRIVTKGVLEQGR